MIHNRVTNSEALMQSYNHDVSDAGSSFENQSKSDVSVETDIHIMEDRFSRDSKFYQHINNNKADSKN